MNRSIKLAALCLSVTILPLCAFADKEKMKEADKNGDGKISKEEFLGHKEAKFKEFDKNSDGALDAAEQKAMMEAMHDKMEHKMGHKDDHGHAH